MFVTCTVLRSTGREGGGGAGGSRRLPDSRPLDPVPPSSHLPSPPLSLSHYPSSSSLPLPLAPHPSPTPPSPPHLPPLDLPKFTVFFILPTQCSFFLPSLGCLLVELWFNAEYHTKCTYELPGAFCETPKNDHVSVNMLRITVG